MRDLTIRCEHCGGERTPQDSTWWLLEEESPDLRTGPLDFCSLVCLMLWCGDPKVQQIYWLDFQPRPSRVGPPPPPQNRDLRGPVRRPLRYFMREALQAWWRSRR